MSDDVLDVIMKHRVVPVIAIADEEAALDLADALLEGGLPVAEITFRTAAAADVIAELTAKRPELFVGAGTVLTGEQVDAAKACGARFAVAPGLNPANVSRAQQAGLPFFPGVATPSDIEIGQALGCRVLKFFPAEALGGRAMLKALSGPYAHTGVKFIPTGGVNQENAGAWLAMDTVAAVGGTWIAAKTDITAGNWDVIRENCRRVREMVDGMA
jgi:2-dehydro-3-deoxyphosphogluconate aldolase / (4S)-4-hydroxy-2-oxoglutarate aldolase